MSGRRYKIIFWLLLTVFVVLGLWWVSYTPFRPDAVFSAIPANATFVTVHKNLAQELTTLTGNPATRDLLISSGIKEEDLNSLCSNRQTQAWIRRLVSRETVLAYVPNMGYQHKPAWVFASWIGGESQRLRWQMRWFKSADLRPVRLEYGRKIWITRTEFPQPEQRLSLALADGMLLGCVSADSTGVRYLLETSDAYPSRPSVLSSGTLVDARALAATNRLHWGWFNQMSSIDVNRFSPSLIGFGVTFLPDGRVDLSLVGNQSLPDAKPLSNHPDYARLKGFLGTSPDLVTVLPLAWARPLFMQTTSPLWAEAVNELTDVRGAPTNALAFLALLNRDHSGRIRGALGKSVALLVGKGLRVPTLMVGLQLNDQREASTRINRMVAVINARYGSSLETRAVTIGEREVTLIAESRNNFYGKFEPGEQVACAVVDRWLILSSNASILRRLLERDSTKAGDEKGDDEHAGAEASAYAWADVNRLGKTMKEALAVTQLAMMAGNSPNSKDTQSSLETVREWIERAQHLEQVSVSMKSMGSGTQMDVVIGR
jgi:hypothetical protein